MRDNIPPSVLRELLKYDPETGVFTWVVRPESRFLHPKQAKVWNKKYGNKRAFQHVNARGYLVSKIYGKAYQAHRVAWAITYGKWPADCIDHINGDPSDNRLGNLREATVRQNSLNSRSPRGTSKYKGVFWLSSGQKWAAAIKVHGKQTRLGSFQDEDDAARSYNQAASKLFGDFAWLNEVNDG